MVHRTQPIEDLDRRWDRNGKCQRAEDDGCHIGHAGGEHVVAPDEEPKKRDGDRAIGDHSVPENPLVAVNAHQFADDTHRRKDHDVHSRVGVEPEEVLERDRVPIEFRIENPDAQEPFCREQ